MSAVAHGPRRAPARQRWVQHVSWGPVAFNAALFTLVVIVFGLLNIAVLYGVSSYQHISFESDQVLADGCLFFYSLTLLGGSFYGLYTFHTRNGLIEASKSVVLMIFLLFIFICGGLTTMNDDHYLAAKSFIPANDILLRFEVYSALFSVVVAFLSNLVIDTVTHSRFDTGHAPGEVEVVAGVS